MARSRNVEDRKLTVGEANELLNVEMEPDFWEALVRMIAYPELAYDPLTETLRFPGYVPFEELARETIEGIEQGIYDVRRCEICAGYFDLDHMDGIFGRPEETLEFICDPCAKKMSARDYFDRYVARGRIFR